MPGQLDAKAGTVRLVRGEAGPSTARQGSPFQADGFVAAWMATRGRAVGTEAWLLVSADGAATLPIEITRRGPLRIGRFPGETHANANGWAVLPGTLPPRLGREVIMAAANAAGSRIDALDLRRIVDRNWLGAEFTVTPAFEERFAISLQGGLDVVLERGNGKRKRKKFRSQQRHFDPSGGYRFLDVPRPERHAALNVFLQQKKARFAALDMPDPFADRGISAFLNMLFNDPAIDTRLYAIESGGVMKSMLGGIVEGDTFWGMFSSYADDADAAISPGELLLWHMVERLSAEGLAALDLGPGSERYKLAWCDRIVPQVDAFLALTARGRLHVVSARLLAAARLRVKRNARLRSLAQSIRRRLGPG